MFRRFTAFKPLNNSRPQLFGQIAVAIAGPSRRLHHCPSRERLIRRLVDGGGPPLCAVDCFPYTASSLRLEPGDTLCLLTDGVTEAAAAGGALYGRERLEALLAKTGPGTKSADVGDAIRQEVTRFTEGVEPSDDLAILVVRWKGPDAIEK